ncbi:oxygen-binding di-iron domain-containing protein [Parasporobacterium paucivorans]|uniref:Stage 0 sporulation protein A homolog n=1 Tax=Parasporobacterium paucivorans DSM 15970 TaxID=1122934 RepID=A0A1M6JZ50_9FIRM|nr:response regulator [Parasporobacterium paucivorans]SHJ51951.1 Diguanylate cyclase, GGDEF domain [Parasporobacterium paucivorans DSM 15970]
MNIIEHIYHVGDLKTLNGLECNPYLLIDGEEGVLFDPGSKLDFEIVLENIKKLIDIDKIKYIVLHHQDPDFCSSVPLFENAGVKAEIVTSWRTMTLVQYYGIQSEYYLLEEHEHELVMGSGRVLRFLPTPYLHFAGAFATYDTKTEVLFSSDLFGAFSNNSTLYADDEYMDKMLAFHEDYMPSNSVLRPVMDTLSRISITMILPQHGSIINKEIPKYIKALRTLECGTLLTPIKKNLLASGGHLRIFNDLMKRLMALYGREKVLAIFRSIDAITISPEEKITEYAGNPVEVFNTILDEIKAQAGMIWIASIEPYVRKLTATYEIQMPTVFESLIKKMGQENEKLQEMNQSLEQTIKAVNERLNKNSITGLFNEVFLKSLLMEELGNENWRDIGAFACIDIDSFSNYKLLFGLEEENIALNNMAYILKEQFGYNAVFKMESTDFGVYLKGYDRRDLIEKMEEVRILISKSELFLAKITVSIGIAFPDEIKLDLSSSEMTATQYMELGFTRLRGAKRAGKNRVCSVGQEELASVLAKSVLIVDSDRTNAEVLKTFIEKLGAEVLIAEDGYQAFEMAEENLPNVIITEINTPKLDGFLLKEKLSSNSKTKNIEVIYLSFQKDEDSVNRALELGVTHYMKKPYLLSELLGLVKRNIKEVN